MDAKDNYFGRKVGEAEVKKAMTSEEIIAFLVIPFRAFFLGGGKRARAFLNFRSSPSHPTLTLTHTDRVCHH